MMSHKLHLVFFWHMHQPYYKDDLEGKLLMPWVFLHAIKDYYDIPWHLSRYPGIKATFNLVPSLLVQLKDYESYDVADKLLESIRRPVDELDYETKAYVLSNLFHAHPETMIKPLERYYTLYLRRQRCESISDQLERFSDEEILDLEVLFLLAWCGSYLRENNPLVQHLILKGARFSEEDKTALLHELADFIKTVIPFYKALQDEGRIMISTTPFYHPILPLLIDMRNGQGANPKTAIPKLQREFREDSNKHVQQAAEFHHALFGSAAECWWPAEGSVCNEALEMIADYGGQWACTDEDVLFKSIGSRDRHHVYRRYRLNSYGRSLGLLFRDKSLSDKIGFDYANLSADEAVVDFFSTLRRIYEHNDADCVVPVILDGENAWEHYPDNGRLFFDKLYAAIQETDWIESSTVQEAFEKPYVPEVVIESIQPGSWINGDFGIWLGEPEENEAWTLLAQAKILAERKIADVDEATAKTIEKELMIAEGSDWFWWFGYDHYTPIKNEFDALFRQHLSNVYRLLGMEVPKELFRPISRVLQSQRHLPTAPVSPVIDGRRSSYFEWTGCGRMELSQGYSAMNAGAKILSGLEYGEDAANLYLAIHSRIEPERLGAYEIRLHFSHPVKKVFALPLQKTARIKGVEYAADHFVEVAIKKDLLGKEIEGAELGIEVLEEGSSVERSPTNGALLLEFGSSGLRQQDWFI